MATLTIPELRRLGFCEATAIVRRTDGAVALENRRRVPARSGVYAILVNSETVYIGASVNLRARLAEHCRSNPKLAEALEISPPVVAAFCCPGWTTWRGFHFRVHFALEDALIARYRPAWNALSRAGRERLKPTEAPLLISAEPICDLPAPRWARKDWTGVWTEDDTVQLQQLVIQGIDDASISVLLGIPRRAVKEKSRSLGYDAPPPGARTRTRDHRRRDLPPFSTAETKVMR